MELSDHKILITGGSSGIGLGLARAFIDGGNAVAICGRSENRLADAKEALGNVHTLRCDLAEPADVAALPRQAVEALGGLTILVNNAGVQKNYVFGEAMPADVARDAAWEIEVNLTSLISLTGACLPILESSESAAIVNVSSALAITPKKSAPVYCATKAGVHSFTQALRYQLEDTQPHIKVFELMPPLVDTPMTAGRHRGDLTPADVAGETLKAMTRDRLEIQVGKTKLLSVAMRIAPPVARKILRNT